MTKGISKYGNNPAGFRWYNWCQFFGTVASTVNAGDMDIKIQTLSRRQKTRGQNTKLGNLVTTIGGQCLQGGRGQIWAERKIVNVGGEEI